jgi:hypothetical protein
MAGRPLERLPSRLDPRADAEWVLQRALRLPQDDARRTLRHVVLHLPHILRQLDHNAPHRRAVVVGTRSRLRYSSSKQFFQWFAVGYLPDAHDCVRV